MKKYIYFFKTIIKRSNKITFVFFKAASSKHSFIAFYLLTGVYNFGYSQSSISLYECWQSALVNYAPFKNDSIYIEIEKLNEKNLQHIWFPQFSLNGQATYQSDGISLSLLMPDPSTQPVSFVRRNIESPRDQYKLTIDIKQNIYDGGLIKNKKEVNKLQTKTNIYENSIELRKLIENINYLYFNVLIAKKSIRLLENVNNILIEREKTIKSAVKNGVLQPNDLDLITIEILHNKQRIDELKTFLDALYANLSSYTQFNINDSTEFTVPEIEISDTAISDKIELRMIENQQKILSVNQEILRSERKPLVYAFIQGGYGRPALNMLSTNFDPFYIVGVGLRWTIWDWNTFRNNKQQLQLQSQLLNSKKSAINQQIETAANLSKAKIMQLENAIKTDSLILKIRSDITKRTARKLDNGVVTATDYLNDLNAELQAQIQLESHLIQLMQEKINYRFIVGIDEESLFLKNVKP